MRMRSWSHLLASTVFCWAALLGAPGAAASNVSIGVFVYQGERAATRLVARPRLPARRAARTPLPLDQYDADGLRHAIADHRVDLVITNPGYYVAMEAEFGISRIATLVTAALRTAGHRLGVFIARRAKDLRELTASAGKRSPPSRRTLSAAIWSPRARFAAQGIDPESDLKEVRFVGLPMTNVIDAVRSGEADAGIVRACLLEQLAQQGQLQIGRLRVLSPRREDGFRADVIAAVSRLADRGDPPDRSRAGARRSPVHCWPCRTGPAA